MTTIFVNGATGALNGATVEHLLERGPADRIGVSMREAGTSDDFTEIAAELIGREPRNAADQLADRIAAWSAPSRSPYR